MENFSIFWQSMILLLNFVIIGIQRYISSSNLPTFLYLPLLLQSTIGLSDGNYIYMIVARLLLNFKNGKKLLRTKSGEFADCGDNSKPVLVILWLHWYSYASELSSLNRAR